MNAQTTTETDTQSPPCGWGVPVPLYMDSATPFPVDALPPVIRDICLDLVKEINGAHINLVAPAALGVLSGAQGSGWVKVKNKWREASPLWVAVVAASGAAKSPVLNALAEPLINAERLAIERDAETRDQRQLDFDIAEEEYIAALDAYKSARREELPTDPAELAQHKQRLEDLSQEAEKRRAVMAAAAEKLGEVPKVLVQGADGTAQAMHDMLAKHNHLLVLVDEGTDLFRTLSDTSQAQTQIWIKAHGMTSHERYVVSRDVKVNTNGSLCMVLVIQPSIIEEYAEDKNISEVGILPRFFLGDARGAVKRPEDPDDFYHPNHPGLHSGYRATPADLAWAHLIHTEVARTWRNRGKPTNWTFTPEGAKVFAANLNNYIVQTNSDPDQESHVHSSLDKVRGMAVRVARIIAQSKIAGPPCPSFTFPIDLQVTGAPVYNEHTDVMGAIYDDEGTISAERTLLIDAESVQSGWTIALWQYNQYRGLFHKSGEDSQMETLVLAALRAVAADKSPYFTVRDLRRGALRFVESKSNPKHKNAPSPSELIEKALDYCVQGNWLYKVKVGKTSHYYPHPQLPMWLDSYGMI